MRTHQTPSSPHRLVAGEPSQMQAKARQPKAFAAEPAGDLAERLNESPRMQAQAYQLRRLFGSRPPGVLQLSSGKVEMKLGEDQDDRLSGERDDALEDEDEAGNLAGAIDARAWLDMGFAVARRFWALVHENLGTDDEAEADGAIRTSAQVKRRLHELFDDGLPGQANPETFFDELLSRQRRLARTAPTDGQMLSLVYGAIEAPADIDRHDSAAAMVRDQLLGWLMEIAAHDVSSAIKHLNLIQHLLGQVTQRVAQIADGAMHEDAESVAVFIRLEDCGFIERMVNIASKGRLSATVLCHHTDTSIPLINCLGNMKPKAKKEAVSLPSAASKAKETPIDGAEMKMGRMALLGEAQMALKALEKVR